MWNISHFPLLCVSHAYLHTLQIPQHILLFMAQIVNWFFFFKTYIIFWQFWHSYNDAGHFEPPLPAFVPPTPVEALPPPAPSYFHIFECVLLTELNEGYQWDCAWEVMTGGCLSTGTPLKRAVNWAVRSYESRRRQPTLYVMHIWTSTCYNLFLTWMNLFNTSWCAGHHFSHVEISLPLLMKKSFICYNSDWMVQLDLVAWAYNCSYLGGWDIRNTSPRSENATLSELRITKGRGMWFHLEACWHVQNSGFNFHYFLPPPHTKSFSLGILKLLFYCFLACVVSNENSVAFLLLLCCMQCVFFFWVLWRFYF